MFSFTKIKYQNLSEFYPLMVFTIVFSLLLTSSLSSKDYISKLKEGNNRFINNTRINQMQTSQDRHILAVGQSPFATVIACSDSRVAPEDIFDQKPGNLFVVRLAGNTLDEFSLASVEFGLLYLRTPLLIVIGHQDCGAVRAAFTLKDSTFSPMLTSVLKKIEPAVVKTIKENPNKSSQELVDIAINKNVINTKHQILNKIPTLKSLIAEGELNVATGVFHIDSGKVLWDQEQNKKLQHIPN